VRRSGLRSGATVVTLRHRCFNGTVAATRGTTWLARAGVTFAVHTYDYGSAPHGSSTAAYAAEALSIPAERFAKTLVAEADGDPVFVLMPGHREVSLRKLARAAGAKHAELADPRDAERLTGYQVGGIGPFGSRRTLPVYVDASLLDHDRIALNGGQRGVILEVASADVVRLLVAVPADLGA
jgi:Cys-tRNA(Pro)/Cys-tRNA(Cys) deacylase